MLDKIYSYILDHPSEISAYQDYFGYIRSLEEPHYDKIKEIQPLISEQVKKLVSKDPKLSIEFYELLKKTYLYMAKDDFESYMIYLEWDREPQDKFYMPRRKRIKPFIESLQKIADDELDELFLSCPPRIGKTTLITFFVTWAIGRDPNKSCLYSAYSDTITQAFYNGITEVIDDNFTYLWHDVFNHEIVGRSAKNETLNLDKPTKYPSVTARSLYGTLNGATNCDNYLIGDDLISGIEEALNKDRLNTAWTHCTNDLLSRAKDQAKIIWIGTRWSKYDPIGRRLDFLENGNSTKRFEVINIPALDDNDESNFDYDYGVGFSTQRYHEVRAQFEHDDAIADFLAQYQGQPIERSGLLFEPDEMRYFNGELPEEGLVRKYMVCDPAFGGGDFTSAPYIYEYEDGRSYVVDVVFSKQDKTITQPLIAQKMQKWNIKLAQFELTKTTMAYKEKVEELLRDMNWRANITSKAAPTHTSKETRIYESAPEIREFYYLESGKRDKMYEMFMQNLLGYTMSGRNKNDDAPDSMAMASQFKYQATSNMTIARRMF